MSSVGSAGGSAGEVWQCHGKSMERAGDGMQCAECGGYIGPGGAGATWGLYVELHTARNAPSGGGGGYTRNGEVIQ